MDKIERMEPVSIGVALGLRSGTGEATMRSAVVLAAGAGRSFGRTTSCGRKRHFPSPMCRRCGARSTAWRRSAWTGSRLYGAASRPCGALRCAGDVRYVRQPAPAGTADAALCGAAGLDEDFLVVYGDVVTDPANLRELIRRFEEERPLAAALVQPLGNERPQDWLVAHTEGEQLVGVEGHGRGGGYRLCGVYALRTDAVGLLRDNPGVMHSVPWAGCRHPRLAGPVAAGGAGRGAAVLAIEAAALRDLDKPWHILEANYQVIEAMRRETEGNDPCVGAHPRRRDRRACRAG